MSLCRGLYLNACFRIERDLSFRRRPVSHPFISLPDFAGLTGQAARGPEPSIEFSTGFPIEMQATENGEEDLLDVAGELEPNDAVVASVCYEESLVKIGDS